MNRPTLLLAALLLLASPVVVRAEQVDLLIVAGQSNAVGFDASPKQLPPSDADKKIMFWWRCGDPPPDRHDSHCGGRWATLQPQPLGEPDREKRRPRQYGNFAQPEGGFGPEFGLARTLARGTSRLAVIKVAFSGTALDRDWRTDDEGPNGACYRSLVNELQLARTAAEKQGVTLRPRGFFWVQGESDANKTDAPQYAGRIARMLHALRTELKSPTLPCFLALNTRFSKGKNPHVPAIVAQQRLSAARDPHCGYVDTSSAPIANGAHYDAKGTLDVGRWFAEALKRHEDRNAQPHRPYRIVALGDSITKGVRSGVSREQTFASRLEAKLNGDGRPAEVINMGIGGERTDQAIKRLEKVISLEPDMVLLMYGTNDSYVDPGKDRSRLALKDYRQNLDAMLRRLLAKGILPVAMTEPRWARGARPNGLGENPNQRLDEYVKTCRDVATSLRLPLVDNFAAWGLAEKDGTDLQEWTTDGCHPNPRGHAAIAERIYPQIRAFVPTQMKARSRLLQGKPLKVVCFGDSVTGVYYHTGSQRAYPDMLRIALSRFSPASTVEVINAGVSGNTTVDALKRLERDVLARKPDLVTVMFGLNDIALSTKDYKRRVAMRLYRENLLQIVERCRAAGAEPVLVTPNAILPTTSRRRNELSLYCDVVRQLGRDRRVTVCDVHQDMSTLNWSDEPNWLLHMSDAIHPNMDGHKRIAAQLARTIIGERIHLEDVAPLARKIKPTAASKVLASILSAEQEGFTAWNLDGLTLTEIRDEAKRRVRKQKPELVLLRIPRNAYKALDDSKFVEDYVWAINWSLNFGPPSWEVVVVHPDVYEPGQQDEKRDALIRRLARAHDVRLIDRPAEGDSSGGKLVRAWLAENGIGDGQR